MRTVRSVRPQPLDRRYNPRTRVRDRAIALIMGREQACVIRDRSDSGLRLVFPKAVELEAQFRFVDHIADRSRLVSLVWTDGRQAGVTFMD